MPNEIQFFQTAMGRTFFEGTMPSLVRELKKLNDNFEKMSKVTEELEMRKRPDLYVQECKMCGAQGKEPHIGHTV